MKMEVRRKSICIIPQNEQDEGFIEEILGLRRKDDTIPCKRVAYTSVVEKGLLPISLINSEALALEVAKWKGWKEGDEALKKVDIADKTLDEMLNNIDEGEPEI